MSENQNTPNGRGSMLKGWEVSFIEFWDGDPEWESIWELKKS